MTSDYNLPAMVEIPTLIRRMKFVLQPFRHLENLLRKIQKINCPTVGVALSSDTTTRLGFARKFCET
ncbi:MAG: hypothetical protein MJK14_13055, partial [Rivularia sp. ALOHA_DT_140]|nr:hypothetical protein [Rivularia sp. ALOHA_DT_140]